MEKVAVVIQVGFVGVLSQSRRKQCCLPKTWNYVDYNVAIVSEGRAWPPLRTVSNGCPVQHSAQRQKTTKLTTKITVLVYGLCVKGGPASAKGRSQAS